MNLDDKLEYGKYKELVEESLIKVNRLSNIRLVLFIGMLFSFILKYYYYPVIFNTMFIIFLFLFIVIIFIYDKYFKLYDYYVKYVEVIKSYLDRKNGNWRNFSDNGEDFLGDDKSFLSDLDILGNCSLFQYLSVCKTLGGRECLVKRLSNLELDNKKIERDQKTIVELIEKKVFSIKFQVIMKYYEGKKINLGKNMQELNTKFLSRKIDFFISIITSIFCILLFLLGIFKIISLSYFYGMFLFNLLISYLYELIFKEEFIILNNTVSIYPKLYQIFDLFINEKFSSSNLKDIQKNMLKTKNDILVLRKIDSINSFKNNLISNIFCNGFGCFNLFLLYRFSNFLECNLNNLKNSILDIEEMESLISLATLGIVRDKWCLPNYKDDIILDFVNIMHPLLDEKICIGNDFNSNHSINIITGSNMGGKTSFLRTIGINLILMQAGGVVCADKFVASYFKIFTSMRIVDNIDKGISTFYGELLSIQKMVDYVDKGNMLVLIDEIFKGTNYQDRMYGARAVIEKLNNKKTIAFITTHDFELCEEKNIHNYYVKEDYVDDKIVFDYKIRKGRVKSTNAKYLMKKLNIID